MYNELETRTSYNYLKEVINSLKKCSRAINKEDYLKAGIQIGHDAQEIKRVFDIVLSQ